MFSFRFAFTDFGSGFGCLDFLEGIDLTLVLTRIPFRVIHVHSTLSTARLLSNARPTRSLEL